MGFCSHVRSALCTCYTTMYRGNDPSDLSICLSMLVICGNLRVGSISTSSCIFQFSVILPKTYLVPSNREYTVDGLKYKKMPLICPFYMYQNPSWVLQRLTSINYFLYPFREYLCILISSPTGVHLLIFSHKSTVA